MLHEWVFSQAEALFDAAAEHLAEQIEHAVAQRGVAMVAVSGGKTPEVLFQRMAQMLLPWRRVHITLVDERFVPADHPDSNEGLLRRSLLQGRVKDAVFVPLFRAGMSLEEAAGSAAHDLQSWPLPFDAIVLGMGDDGHTASWFPDAPELPQLLAEENAELVGVAHPQRAPHARLSLTRTAVLNSRMIQLLIPGISKQAVYQRARAATEPVAELPVRAVLHQQKVPVQVYRTA